MLPQHTTTYHNIPHLYQYTGTMYSIVSRLYRLYLYFLDTKCANISSFGSNLHKSTCIVQVQTFTSPRVLFISGLGSPEGIAIDWISRNMYWTDSVSDSINVAGLDGSNRKVLFNDIKNPRGIAVDPVAG